jgi:hypothetical protein
MGTQLKPLKGEPERLLGSAGRRGSSTARLLCPRRTLPGAAGSQIARYADQGSANKNGEDALGVRHLLLKPTMSARHPKHSMADRGYSLRGESTYDGRRLLPRPIASILAVNPVGIRPTSAHRAHLGPNNSEMVSQPPRNRPRGHQAICSASDPNGVALRSQSPSAGWRGPPKQGSSMHLDLVQSTLVQSDLVQPDLVQSDLVQRPAVTAPTRRRRSRIDERLDWAFDPIELCRPARPGARPRLARIEIEADLLGFTVRQSNPGRRTRSGPRLFLVSLDEAILEAGRLVHERLSEGYVASTGLSD